MNRALYYLTDGYQNDAYSSEQNSGKSPLENRLLIAYVDGVLFKESYNSIQYLSDYAKRDSVDALAMIIDSPGGLVAGLMETCSELKEIGKPIYAYTSGMACSAAYALASCADRFYTSPSADVGSVGARIMHIDISKALEEFGVKITEVGFGKRKTQFSPFHSLSKDDKKDLEEYVREAYDDFVRLVKKERVGVDDAVYESGVFSGKKALKMGLSDGIISTENKFINFVKLVLDNRQSGVES